MSNPVDRGIKAGLQRERSQLIAGTMADNTAAADARAREIEERQAWQDFRERRSLRQRHETKLDRDGKAFEARQGRGAEGRGQGRRTDLEL